MRACVPLPPSSILEHLLAASREESTRSCLPRPVSFHRSLEDASDAVSSDSRGQAGWGWRVTVSLLPGGGVAVPDFSRIHLSSFEAS